ncbi:MAG: hypothetical protein ACI9S8_001956 [Chlamydiales bacterium]|jgi:hypothetical protein
MSFSRPLSATLRPCDSLNMPHERSSYTKRDSYSHRFHQSIHPLNTVQKLDRRQRLTTTYHDSFGRVFPDARRVENAIQYASPSCASSMDPDLSLKSTGYYSRMRNLTNTSFGALERRNQGYEAKSLIYSEIPKHKEFGRKLYSAFARFTMKRVDVFSPHVCLYRDLMHVLEERSRCWSLSPGHFSEGSELEKLLARVLKQSMSEFGEGFDLESFKVSVQEGFRR